ncbi:MAG TPA: methylated-DNA--[protein]-cysteine S-methyltransferase [Gemmatimonadales bacterium]|jgi:AraC family transcriptional regulator of adaptative response/methylated-DNA-[protein]-cysteine methyltransferase
MAESVIAVRTTRIFCRDGCPARPNPENKTRMASAAEALLAGYRPCKRCHPLHEPGKGPAPGAPIVTLARIETPLGPMISAVTGDELVLLEFGDRRMVPTQLKRLASLLRCRFEMGDTPLLAKVRRQLDEYFAGKRREFDVPVSTPGTAFQRAAWDALRRIPVGSTRSYAEQAVAIGRPSAVRAVARANGDNRIAILIPCHRVVGSDGDLTGYGGGIWRKKALLEREGATVG